MSYHCLRQRVSALSVKETDSGIGGAANAPLRELEECLGRQHGSDAMGRCIDVIAQPN